MIRLPNPKMRDLLEAMPVKCRVAGTLHSPNAVDGSGARDFYKAVTTEVFSPRLGQVAFVDAAEWAREKEAHKTRTEESETEKRLTPRQKMLRTLKRAESRWINLYFEFSSLAESEKGGLMTVAATDTAQYSDVLLVPPTTTGHDLLTLLKPLTQTPPLPAMHKRIMHLLEREHDMQDHKNRLERQTTFKLATLIARALKQQKRGQPVMGAHQPLPGLVTAPAMVMLMNPHNKSVSTPVVEEKEFFKAVHVYDIQKMIEGEMSYVPVNEWIDREYASVQMYARLDARARKIMGAHLGTLDAANEGLSERNHILLIPASTSSATLKKTIDDIIKSRLDIQSRMRTMDRIDIAMKRGWLKIAMTTKREKDAQTLLLHKAFPPAAWTSTN